MYESQSPERFSAERKTVQFRDENAVSISDDHMGDRSAPVDQYPELLPELRRDAGEIAGEFLGDDLVCGDSAAIDFPDQIEKPFFQAGRMSVYCRYLANL